MKEPLSYDTYRCVGDVIAARTEGMLKVHPICNNCRRREPGHPDRQIYLMPAIYDDGEKFSCPNQIL